MRSTFLPTVNNKSRSSPPPLSNLKCFKRKLCGCIALVFISFALLLLMTLQRKTEEAVPPTRRIISAAADCHGDSSFSESNPFCPAAGSTAASDTTDATAAGNQLRILHSELSKEKEKESAHYPSTATPFFAPSLFNSFSSSSSSASSSQLASTGLCFNRSASLVKAYRDIMMMRGSGGGGESSSDNTQAAEDEKSVVSIQRAEVPSAPCVEGIMLAASSAESGTALLDERERRRIRPPPAAAVDRVTETRFGLVATYPHRLAFPTASSSPSSSSIDTTGIIPRGRDFPSSPPSSHPPPLRVAVAMSGQMRSWRLCHQSLVDRVLVPMGLEGRKSRRWREGEGEEVKTDKKGAATTRVVQPPTVTTRALLFIATYPEEGREGFEVRDFHLSTNTASGSSSGVRGGKGRGGGEEASASDNNFSSTTTTAHHRHLVFDKEDAEEERAEEEEGGPMSEGGGEGKDLLNTTEVAAAYSPFLASLYILDAPSIAVKKLSKEYPTAFKTSASSLLKGKGGEGEGNEGRETKTTQRKRGVEKRNIGGEDRDDDRIRGDPSSSEGRRRRSGSSVEKTTATTTTKTNRYTVWALYQLFSMHESYRLIERYEEEKAAETQRKREKKEGGEAKIRGKTGSNHNTDSGEIKDDGGQRGESMEEEGRVRGRRKKGGDIIVRGALGAERLLYMRDSARLDDYRTENYDFNDFDGDGEDHTHEASSSSSSGKHRPASRTRKGRTAAAAAAAVILFDIVVRVRPDLYILGPLWLSWAQTPTETAMAGATTTTTTMTPLATWHYQCEGLPLTATFKGDGTGQIKEGNPSSSTLLFDSATVLRTGHHPRYEYTPDPVSDHTAIMFRTTPTVVHGRRSNLTIDFSLAKHFFALYEHGRERVLATPRRRRQTKRRRRGAREDAEQKSNAMEEENTTKSDMLERVNEDESDDEDFMINLGREDEMEEKELIAQSNNIVPQSPSANTKKEEEKEGDGALVSADSGDDGEKNDKRRGRRSDEGKNDREGEDRAERLRAIKEHIARQHAIAKEAFHQKRVVVDENGGAALRPNNENSGVGSGGDDLFGRRQRQEEHSSDVRRRPQENNRAEMVIDGDGYFRTGIQLFSSPSSSTSSSSSPHTVEGIWTHHIAHRLTNLMLMTRSKHKHRLDALINPADADDDNNWRGGGGVGAALRSSPSDELFSSSAVATTAPTPPIVFRSVRSPFDWHILVRGSEEEKRDKADNRDRSAFSAAGNEDMERGKPTHSSNEAASAGGDETDNIVWLVSRIFKIYLPSSPAFHNDGRAAIDDDRNHNSTSGADHHHPTLSTHFLCPSRLPPRAAAVNTEGTSKEVELKLVPPPPPPTTNDSFGRFSSSASSMRIRSERDEIQYFNNFKKDQ